MSVCLCVAAMTHAHNVTVLSGSTVTLDCQPPHSSYSGYFEWRYYSSDTDEWIYSQPPYQHNDADFSPTRYHRVDDYGLEVSTVRVQDGGVYGCHFLTGDVLKYSTVIVIGEIVFILVFTALTGIQTLSSHGISVCLTVKRVHCDKTKKNLSRFLYHAKDHSVYFSEKKNCGWGRPLLSEILGQPAPLERNRRF